MATDPVCGMAVDEATALSAVRDGLTHYFCGEHCRQSFLGHGPGSQPAPAGGPPEHGGQPAAAGAAAAQYTCPMHPQVVRDGPGSCPICGMALEPRTVAVEEGPSPELADMSRRFWVGVVLGLPVFALAMADLVPGRPLHHLLDTAAANWVQMVLRRRSSSGAGGRSSRGRGPPWPTAAPTCSR